MGAFFGDVEFGHGFFLEQGVGTIADNDPHSGDRAFFLGEISVGFDPDFKGAFFGVFFLDSTNETNFGAESVAGDFTFFHADFAGCGEGVVEGFWLGAGDNGNVEGLTCGLDVVFELFTSHLEGAAVVAESVRRHRILGDVLNVVDVEPEEVPQGVLVLITSQPTQDDLAAFALECFVGVFDGGIEPGQNDFAFFGGEVLLIIGGHFAKVDDAAYIMPGFGGTYIFDEVGGEGVEADLAFLFLLSVATKAFLLQDGANHFFVVGRFCSFWESGVRQEQA